MKKEFETKHTKILNTAMFITKSVNNNNEQVFIVRNKTSLTIAYKHLHYKDNNKKRKTF